jgi:glycosyltransferase involved in cell wall biosynthesis
VINLVNHNGFIEPSFGVAEEGFAIRNKARLVVRLSDSFHFKKIKIQLHRTSCNWPSAYIKLRINHNLTHKLKVENIGQKEFSIDLADTFDIKNLELTFSVFPKGIIKNIYKFFLGKRKSLLRDSILLSRVYFGENKIINYYDNNRFACRDSLQQNQIPVRILGFFGQTFGLAEAARRTFTSLKKSGCSVTATQIPYSGKHQGSDHTIRAEKKIPTNTDEIRIFHFNGDHFEKLISDWGESILDCKYKIGFWHWELPEFPDDYLSWFDMVDEIWVPSRFVFDAIAPKSPKPVQIIPLALDEAVLKPPPPDRENFNIPKDKIVFLITFDFYSIMERKNPVSGIEAFKKLLEDDKYKDKIHLVVKISNQHANDDGFKTLLAALINIEKGKITLLDNVLSRHDMLVLINSCDCLISLHRSEGFGLHLAEAMAMGKEVFATNWSGNTDFMNSKNSLLVEFDLVSLEDDFGPYRKGCRWASPFLDDAVSKMKIQLKNDCNNNMSISNRAKADVREIHSLKNVSSIIKDRVRVIWRNLERN